MMEAACASQRGGVQEIVPGVSDPLGPARAHTTKVRTKVAKLGAGQLE